MSYDNVIQAFGPKPLSRRQMKYSPERVEQIKNLVERGKSREEIAALIGVTVGSLQVSCSRLRISLRRPKVNNGTRLLRRSRSEQPPYDSQLEPPEHIQPTILRRERPKTDEARLANFVLRMRYKGEERTTELPLTNDMIVQLAFEAEFRGMRVGELVAELVTAMTQKGLIQLVLDAKSAGTSPE